MGHETKLFTGLNSPFEMAGGWRGDVGKLEETRNHPAPRGGLFARGAENVNALWSERYNAFEFSCRQKDFSIDWTGLLLDTPREKKRKEERKKERKKERKRVVETEQESCGTVCTFGID